MQTSRRLLPGLVLAGIIMAMAVCALIWTAKRVHLNDRDLKTTANRSPPVNSAVLSTQEPAPVTPMVPDQTPATG